MPTEVMPVVQSVGNQTKMGVCFIKYTVFMPVKFQVAADLKEK